MVRLQTVGLSSVYRRDLRRGWDWILERARNSRVSLHALDDPRKVDRLLGKWVQEAFDDGERLHNVVMAIVAAQRRLHMSGSLLRGTWAAIKGWRMSLPSRPRVPITKLALEAVILGGFCLGMNQSGHLRRRWWAMSLISWLAFECLLRPSEAINLLVGDIVFPSLELAGPDPNLVVVIRNPKTRRIWRTQFAICSDFFLIDWLKWWCRDLDSKCRVFPISRAQWSSLLKACCGWLDVDNIGYTPSSFRSGGATHVFRTEQNLGRLQYRGRWKSAATLESYLQEAMSAHATHVVSDRGRERVAVVRQAVHRLKSPPEVAAIRLFRGL